jgi:hypothetical protein
MLLIGFAGICRLSEIPLDRGRSAGLATPHSRRRARRFQSDRAAHSVSGPAIGRPGQESRCGPKRSFTLFTSRQDFLGQLGIFN